MTKYPAIIKILAFATAALIAPSCFADQTLTVAWYGANWGDSFNACVAGPFTKATGIKVIPEIGTSSVTLSKLQQQKSAPAIDAAWMDGGFSELALAAGVVDHIEAQAVPNLSNVLQEAVYSSNATTYAVGTGYYSLGIAYNTEKVKRAPASWNDLWNPEFEDAVTIPSPSNSSGVPFIFFLNQMWKGPANDFSETFKRIKQLHAALFWDSSGAATNAYQRGEAIIGAHFSVGAWDLADKGLPVRFVVPKEGVWATDARLHLIKGAPHKQAAEKFINMALTKEASACLAEKLYLGPSVKGTAVSPASARKLPWGENGSVKDLHLFDWTIVNKERANIVDRWNREIAHK
jgi:putative spermidine/putrescine transport system substrate-binding protein